VLCNFLNVVTKEKGNEFVKVDNEACLMDDSLIISRINSGEPAQYSILVKKYQSMIFRTCMGLLHQREDAEDVTQEVFVKAFRAIGSFKGDASFSTWIYRIAVNEALTLIRRRQRERMLRRLGSWVGFAKEQEDFSVERLTQHESDPESLMIKDEQTRWVNRVIDELPERQRIAFTLSRYGDLSQREVAQTMGLTEGAVESLLQRAKQNIRKKISVDGKNK
jgi:RNA polymerase sigma-70 factor (ECF subfamily)